MVRNLLVEFYDTSIKQLAVYADNFFKFGLRFYFVSYDCIEPPHIHIGDDAKKICKYWLKDGNGILADNSAFNKRDLARIEKVISENFKTLLKAFNEYCKGYKK